MPLLAADIGGTKTLLALQDTPDTPPVVTQVSNDEVTDLATLLTGILGGRRHVNAVLAIAGPIDGQRCRMTNLPWEIDACDLQTRLGCGSLRLVNDLVATAAALPGLASSLTMLRGEAIDFRQPVAVMSLGTGLGEAALVPDASGEPQSIASEGGHTSFAPHDADSLALLQAHLARGHAMPDWEDWYSGHGLPNLHAAGFPDAPRKDAPMIIAEALASPASPAAITVTRLVNGLYAEAGNMVLQYVAWGGIIMAGGMVQHLRPWLDTPAAQRCLETKPRFGERLCRVSIALCTDTHAALKGALRMAQTDALVHR